MRHNRYNVDCRATYPTWTRPQPALFSNSVHIGFVNIVQPLLVGQVVLNFPLWPLFGPVAYGAGFNPLSCAKGRSAAAALASCRWIFRDLPQLPPWFLRGYPA
jgi:hypothetical protein